MPYLRSANPSQFQPLAGPGEYGNYQHGANSRSGFIPLAFQVTNPYDKTRALMPHALITHVNPSSFNETFNKKVERFQTRGGWVEQHWGDDLEEISVDASTGAFINLYTGLSSVLRKRTIAWDRYRDLYDLYRNDGSVYDPYGNIVLQGFIMLLYDRGTYLGTFRSFSVEETDDSPFAFKISWTFKVEEIVYQTPINGGLSPRRPAALQSRNQTNANLGDLLTPTTDQTVSQEQLNQQLQASAESQASRAAAAKAFVGNFGVLGLIEAPTQSDSSLAGTPTKLPLK
jgi:hypothetical protein